ncbi:MAG: hypothetical protein AB1602_00815 [Elusimicrobiota bacterium]
MNKFVFIIFIFVFCGLSFSELSNIKKEEIKQHNTPKPEHQTDYSQTDHSDSKISVYYSGELFPFETEAKKACENMSNKFKEYEISIIGCNTVEKENNYSYSIEYLSRLTNPEKISSVIIKEYEPNKTYWNESLAKKELNNSVLKFKNSPLKIIDYQTIEKMGEYSFKIKYAVNNVLKKSKEYYVAINKITAGKYTFESEAKKDIQRVISLLKQNNISALNGSVTQNGNDYSIEIEYFNKTDGSNSSFPEYSIENYSSEEKFPFEDNALKEGTKRNEAFSKAGINVIHNFAIPLENDWSFSTDYIIKNIYRNGSLLGKEFKITRYQNPNSFDFENQAKKALEEKIKNFNSAGLYVISSNIYETANSYSFYIDYIEKNSFPKTEK